MQSGAGDFGGPGSSNPMQRKTTFKQKVAIFRDTNFLLYWTSGNISFLGDIFAMYAMQLLVMHLTDGNAAAMGTVMAITGIPRVLFMLFGGVLIDRFSPLRVVILVRYVMAVSQFCLAILVFSGVMQIWMLYVFAVATGALGSFLMPAQMSMMPSILKLEDLPAGNALNGSAHQIIQSMAPAIVGFLLAYLSGYDIFGAEATAGDPAQKLVAYSYAFFINTGTFIVSAIMLGWLRLAAHPTASRDQKMLRSIWEGFEMVWRDPPLRAFIVYMSCSTIFTMGAQAVGQPIMALQRFEEVGIMPAAAALGLFGSATGAGAIFGSLFSGFVVRPSERMYGPVMMLMAVLRGSVLLGLSFIDSLYGVMALFACFGLFMGYTSVLFMSWMQMRVPISMLGRLMSVMMFSMMGLMPVSMALAGWGIEAFGLEVLYFIAGCAMIFVAICGSFSKSIRLLGYTPHDAARMLGKELPTDIAEEEGVMAGRPMGAHAMQGMRSRSMPDMPLEQPEEAGGK